MSKHNFNRYKLKAISCDLNNYDYLAKKDDFVEISAWQNGEGYNITFNEDTYGFTHGQIKAINKLIKKLENETN